MDIPSCSVPCNYSKHWVVWVVLFIPPAGLPIIKKLDVSEYHEELVFPGYCETGGKQINYQFYPREWSDVWMIL